MKKDDLISHLRNEAHDVKDCFTRFSFQALAISAAAIGIIIRFQNDFPIVSISSVSVTILVMMVAKIGNHKYNTANRNLGFLLYLERMEAIKSERPNIEQFRETVPWEEAMRAWRIVQATSFSKVYRLGRILPNKRKIGCKEEEYIWFEPITIATKYGAKYYAGSYLEAVQTILFFMAGISIVPHILSAYLFYSKSNMIGFYGFLIVSIGSGLIILWRISRIKARRKILENGLLSIHSCSILWEAVMIAHKNALSLAFKTPSSKCKDNNENDHPYKSYTMHLSIVAAKIAESICNIHNWIECNRA